MAQRNYTKTQGREGQSGVETGRTARAAVTLFILGILLAAEASTAPGPQALDYDLVIAQVPHHPDRHTASPGQFRFSNAPQDGGRIIALSARGVFTILTPEFVSAIDPSLSYDGEKVLFAGKRSAGDRWNIWEMGLDGSGKRQITSEFGNCREPRYLATSSITAPEFTDKVRWITFTSDAANALDEQAAVFSTALYAQNIEPIEGRGIVTRRSTFNLSSDFSPTVLSDGRVLFTSRQPGNAHRHPNGRFPLLVTNWDGTGLNIFCSGSDGPLLKTMACQTPDRYLVFVESEGDTIDGSGQLARVSLRRPLRSREVLSRGGGFYRSPYPLPDGRLVVSFTRGAESRGVFLFDMETGAPGRRIHWDSKWDDDTALVVAARPEPQGLISAVVDTDKTADLHCLSVYESDMPEAKEIKRGDVAHVRFVEGIPIAGSRQLRPAPASKRPAGNLRTRILGEAPVEQDGSFFVRIPGDTPFYIQTLDRRGMAIQTLQGWIWVRSGTSRGCIGCHENKELAPENRVTQALTRVIPHAFLEPPENRRRSADFRISLQPLLRARCAVCHAGSAAAGSLDLSLTTDTQASQAYEYLLERRTKGSNAGVPLVQPGNARKSALIQLLWGGPGAPGTDGRHPSVALNDGEMRTLIEWIDLGAMWEN